MADVLKATLFWNANPTDYSQADLSGSGNFMTEYARITAAQSHDASDATFESFTASGDGGSFEGNAYGRLSSLLQACPAGGIKFVRVKFRARWQRTNGIGTALGGLMAFIAGFPQGSEDSLTNAFVNYQHDFLTDPADGAMWTKAKIDAQKFGFQMHPSTVDPGNFATESAVQVAEFSVEIWGQDVSVNATGAESLAVANAVTGAGGEAIADPGTRDAATVSPLRSQVDETSSPVTVRSGTAIYRDQDLATANTYNHGPGGSGTDLKDLGGLQGSAAINGSGTIAGVKLFVTVRPTKNGGAGSLTNFKFGTAMGLKTLLAQPTVYDNSGGVTLAMFQTLESTLITLGQFGNPFEWGNGVDSIWASLVGPTWTLNYDWTGGTQVRVEIAEAWIEVHGPLGTKPETIELVQVIGSHLKTFPLSREV